RDRAGLPESIRFWKNRIEEMDPDSTFAVGLMYGPSGCGKSSLAKAGLLPRLAKSVTAVYVEATAEETEARLLKGLRRQLADLPGDLGLVESLAVLRQGRYLEAGIGAAGGNRQGPCDREGGREAAVVSHSARADDGGGAEAGRVLDGRGRREAPQANR